MTPEDCAAEYRLDLLRLRRIPLNGANARELWLLTPWGTWQYFRILDDRVIEIRADGTPLLTESAEPARIPSPTPVRVPDSAPAVVPAVESLPGVYPVRTPPLSEEGG